jgi:hypothetical protein
MNFIPSISPYPFGEAIYHIGKTLYDVCRSVKDFVIARLFNQTVSTQIPVQIITSGQQGNQTPPKPLDQRDITAIVAQLGPQPESLPSSTAAQAEPLPPSTAASRQTHQPQIQPVGQRTRSVARTEPFTTSIVAQPEPRPAPLPPSIVASRQPNQTQTQSVGHTTSSVAQAEPLPPSTVAQAESLLPPSTVASRQPHQPQVQPVGHTTSIVAQPESLPPSTAASRQPIQTQTQSVGQRTSSVAQPEPLQPSTAAPRQPPQTQPEVVKLTTTESAVLPMNSPQAKDDISKKALICAFDRLIKFAGDKDLNNLIGWLKAKPLIECKNWIKQNGVPKNYGGHSEYFEFMIEQVSNKLFDANLEYRNIDGGKLEDNKLLIRCQKKIKILNQLKSDLYTVIFYFDPHVFRLMKLNEATTAEKKPKITNRQQAIIEQSALEETGPIHVKTVPSVKVRSVSVRRKNAKSSHATSVYVAPKKGKGRHAESFPFVIKGALGIPKSKRKEKVSRHLFRSKIAEATSSADEGIVRGPSQPKKGELARNKLTTGRARTREAELGSIIWAEKQQKLLREQQDLLSTEQDIPPQFVDMMQKFVKRMEHKFPKTPSSRAIG